MSTTSANARRRPIRKRSASLWPATKSFDLGMVGIATTPSSVITKFA
jgi:hypothetical protein